MAINSPPEARLPVTGWLPHKLSSLQANECTFFELRMPPSIEVRGGGGDAVSEVVRLAQLQKRPQDSFVETLLEVGAEKGLADKLLDAATFHQPLSQNLRRIDLSVSSELSSSTLEDLCNNVEPGCMLVLSSRVRTKDGEMHLPMLDFKLPRDANHDKLACRVGDFLGGGTLLSSGSSYHLYGARLLNRGTFERWLLKGQLLAKYVDGRWVTHQLLERQAALRISKNGAGVFPYVLD